MPQDNFDCDVAIVGAGPSGTISACLLRQKGYRVIILERQRFPRFVIGESLLPQSLKTLEKAGCLEAVKACGFQYKSGATFKLGRHYANIIFEKKFTDGPGHAYHVERAKFDLLLADCSIKQGAEIRYQHTVTAVKTKLNDCHIDFTDEKDQAHRLRCRFILDASGYGRVLPRLLSLDKPSSLPTRASLFTHITDRIPSDSPHNRQTTLITIHPRQKDVWFWLISFASGRSSVGAVGNLDYLKSYQERGLSGLKSLIAEDKPLNSILQHAEFDTPVQAITGYSSSVSRFYGDGFALLGNAAEFLDPVFSSGVTVAMYSSDLAAQATDKTLSGQLVDWEKDYLNPLMRGVDVFRYYVESWYDETLQKVIFSENSNANIKAMIASILAGYAWDKNNPFVKDLHRLETIAELCR